MSHYLTEFELPIGNRDFVADGTACGDVIDLGDGHEVIVMAIDVVAGPSPTEAMNFVRFDYDSLPDFVQEEIDSGLVEDYR